MGDGGHKCPKK